MLFRFLSEVVVGVLLAGIILAFMVPAAMRLGYTTGPWLGVATAAGAIALCVVAGERMNKRRKARELP
ncbi:MAG: hypothetical protein Q8N51_02965 [Gammaproteobacteria bacterium]|nr:hypothetical protein [Gammaproteobacteria bacterium]